MGALNLMMNEAIDAINELGKKEDSENDGYHFEYDPNTRSFDDVTIRAGNNEFVLAIVWKNLPGYQPCLPNLRKAFDNCGWTVRNTDFLKNLVSELKDCIENNKKYSDGYMSYCIEKADNFLNSLETEKK